MKLFPILLQGKGIFGVPHDSTQGVPDFVFKVCWIIILLFLVRLEWEYRDKIFNDKKPPSEKQEQEKDK